MSDRRKAILGSASSFWLYDSETGFDLTHPPAADAPLIYPRVPLQTTTSKIAVDPAKCALVIIDMQNFFLSPNLGKPKDSKGIKACDQLLKHAIPACRKAGIRIIWCNWGLTQHEIDHMPPATLRAFGFSTVPYDSEVHHQVNGETAVDYHGINQGAEETAKQQKMSAPTGKDPRLYRGLGSEIGPVKLDDGSTVEAGRLLMRDQWNSALYAPMEAARQEGLKDGLRREDVWIHKNRMSGLWGDKTMLTEYLEAEGIRTLFHAGVNTDQCVGGTLQDAFTKGYDCLLLSDGSATTTPDANGGQACVEFNTAKTWGFTLSCKDLAEGVDNIILGK